MPVWAVSRPEDSRGTGLASFEACRAGGGRRRKGNQVIRRIPSLPEGLLWREAVHSAFSQSPPRGQSWVGLGQPQH